MPIPPNPNEPIPPNPNEPIPPNPSEPIPPNPSEPIPPNPSEPNATLSSDVSPAATEPFLTRFLQHRHSLYAFISKQLVHPVDAEDVFQKTSMVLWRKMDEFEPDGNFFGWACGVAFNEVRNFLTGKRRSRLHFDIDLTQLLAEEAAEECDLSESRLSALRACMGNLAPRQQEILRRCYMSSETITDIAKGLGRERSALYKQLARLKQKVLDCIRRRLGLEGSAG